MRLIISLLILLVLKSAGVVAQVNTMPGEASVNNTLFLYEVKLVDEFIERFNDDPSSYIREQCKALYGTDNMITRSRLLKTLFNKGQKWSADTGLFFKEVLDIKNARYLSFTDSTWYAETRCIFLYNNKKVEIPLLLHIKTENKGFKWMIAGIGNSEVFKGKTPPPMPVGSFGPPTGEFIPTSSHGTDFLVFNNVFTDKMHPRDYFEPTLLATTRAQYIISLIMQHKATFQYVHNIRYHFYQVDNWIFTIDQFKRNDANKGWLISSLQKVSPQAKAMSLKKLLYQ